MYLRLNGVVQIGSVETGDENLRFLQSELMDYVVPHLRCSGGGKRDDWNTGKALAKGFQVTIMRSEIVAPL